MLFSGVLERFLDEKGFHLAPVFLLIVYPYGISAVLTPYILSPALQDPQQASCVTLLRAAGALHRLYACASTIRDTCLTCVSILVRSDQAFLYKHAHICAAVLILPASMDGAQFKVCHMRRPRQISGFHSQRVQHRPSIQCNREVPSLHETSQTMN